MPHLARMKAVALAGEVTGTGRSAGSEPGLQELLADAPTFTNLAPQMQISEILA